MATIIPISFLDRPESYSLDVLWSGLCHLNSIVTGLEQTRIKEHPRAKDMTLMSFDSACDSGDPMLLNYFFWYSCSADSFLDLFCKTFGIPELQPAFNNMRRFRDQVSAHLSHVYPLRDNTETQSASLRQFVTWDTGTYSVGREITVDGNTQERSPAVWGWELTKIHEELEAFVRRNIPSS